MQIVLDESRTDAIVVTWGQTIFWSPVQRDTTVRIAGQALTYAADVSAWVWQVPRQVGWLGLEVLDADGAVVKTIMVEITASGAYQQRYMRWSNALAAYDTRLLDPASHIVYSSLDRARVAQAWAGLGMQAMLRAVLAFWQRSAHQVRPWDGSSLATPRWDRIGVSAEPPGLVAEVSTPYFLTAPQQQRVLTALAVVVSICHDATERQICQDIHKHMTLPVPLPSRWAMEALMDWAETIHALPLTATVPVIPSATMDVALLYERWVWLQTMLLVQSPQAVAACLVAALDRGHPSSIALNEQVWCGYQHRISPGEPALGLWSRDYRVAIPDVLLGCTDAAGELRVLCVDAKFRMQAGLPSANAVNDVTAYMARVGVGRHAPDAVVLVHAGLGWGRHASGLWMIDDSEVAWQHWRTWVQQWLHGDDSAR